MSGLQFFKDDLLVAVGRIAVLRGNLRLMLLSTGDTLLATHLGDQGVVRLTMFHRELPDICQVLLTLAHVRGVAPEAVAQLNRVADDYRADFDSATAVANASWTYLGGTEEAHFGLFLSTAAHDGRLEPRWHDVTIAELDRLARRLEEASEVLRPWVSACREASSLG